MNEGSSNKISRTKRGFHVIRQSRDEKPVADQRKGIRSLTFGIHVAGAVSPLSSMELLQDDGKTVYVSLLGPPDRAIGKTQNLGCHP